LRPLNPLCKYAVSTLKLQTNTGVLFRTGASTYNSAFERNRKIAEENKEAKIRANSDAMKNQRIFFEFEKFFLKVSDKLDWLDGDILFLYGMENFFMGKTFLQKTSLDAVLHEAVCCMSCKNPQVSHSALLRFRQTLIT